jgi:proline dehydrogenase
MYEYRKKYSHLVFIQMATNPQEMLNEVKNTIESWEKYHQIEVLRILHQREKNKLNENKNGIFVNLSYLQEDTLAEILKYIDYVKQQTSTLNSVENEKEIYKQTYFSSRSNSFDHPF